MPGVDIAVLPGEIGAKRVGCAAVVDVLRATTTIVSLLDAGAEGVVPAGEMGEARAIKERCPDWLLAGERGGVAPDGFDMGNSPLHKRVSGVAGRAVVLTTTNGTRAVGAAAACADEVLAMALTNLDAVRARLGELGGDVLVVCSGTDGGRSLEDEFAAGILAERLSRDGWDVTARAEGVRDAARRLLDDSGSVEAAIDASPHASGLKGLGFAADVAFCARVGVSETVPALRAGADPCGLPRFVAS